MTGLLPLRAGAATIDTFATFQSAATSPPGGAQSVLVSPPGASGATRTLFVGGVASPAYLRLTIDGGSLRFVQGSDPDGGGSASVTWAYSQPIDLTDGGAANSFLLNFVPFTTPVGLLVTVDSPCSDPGCTLAESTSVLMDFSNVYSFFFADLQQSLGASQAANLTAVNKITLGFVPLGEILAGGLDINGPFATVDVPEPGTAMTCLGVLVALGAQRLWTRRSG